MLFFVCLVVCACLLGYFLFTKKDGAPIFMVNSPGEAQQLIEEVEREREIVREDPVERYTQIGHRFFGVRFIALPIALHKHTHTHIL